MSLGTAGEPAGFAAAVDLLEATRIDSLWLPELVYDPAVEPFTGIAFALARTRRLKAGSGISVLPGRHPVLVAKQLASLAGLAPGRVLPVFGLRPALAAERDLFPVPPGQRAAVFGIPFLVLHYRMHRKHGLALQRHQLTGEPRDELLERRGNRGGPHDEFAQPRRQVRRDHPARARPSVRDQ